MPGKKKNFFPRFVIPFFTLVVFLAPVAKVHAHGVYVFARVEGDRITKLPCFPFRAADFFLTAFQNFIYICKNKN